MRRLLYIICLLLLVGQSYSQIDSMTNFGKANVSRLYTSTDTLIVLDSLGSRFPVSGWKGVYWNVEDYPDPSDDPNREIVYVQNNSGDTLDVLRGQDGTSASNKNTAGKTYRIIISALASHFDSIRTSLGTKLAKADTVSLSNRINLKADTSSVLFWADTNVIATQSDISDFMVHGDTASLSGRIDLKLTAADTTSLSNRIGAKQDSSSSLTWPDTTDWIATQYDLSVLEVGGLDTTSLSNRINLKADSSTVLYWPDTTDWIATQYDLSVLEVGGIDTTSLSNRINLKADTADVLYWPDTTATLGTQYDLTLKMNLADSMKWILRQDSLLKDPTGFQDRGSTITFTDADHEFKIVGPFDVYLAGKKFTKASDSIAVDSTSGLHYIYYDSLGVLNQGTDAWQINSRNAPVATVYYNATTAKGILSDERHGFMQGIVHEYVHETMGSKFVSGMPVGVSLTGDTIRVGSGEWYDDDIEFIPAVQESLMLFYRVSTDWEWVGPQRMYFDTLVNVPAFDDGGTRTAVGVAKYSHTWIFMTNNVSYPLVAIMGQGEYNTAALAEAVTPSSLALGDLPTKEALLLYRITWQRNGSAVTWIQTADYRSQSGGQAINYVATDHAALSNLDFASSGHTGFLGWSDTTATVATIYDVSLKLNSADTTSLSNRIGAKADSSTVLYWADTTANIGTKYDLSLKLNSAAIDTSTVLFWADTVSTIATAFDISDFMVHGDTTSLSNRIGARADSSTALYWADTTLTNGIATNADLNLKLNSAALDTSTVVFWPDTTATIATSYDLTLKLNTAALDTSTVLFWADTTARIATNFDIADFMVHGDTTALSNRIGARADSATALYWADTTIANVGLVTQNDLAAAIAAGVSTNVDSLVHKFVDSTGRAIGNLQKMTAVVYNSDSSKYKSLAVAKIDTTGLSVSSTGLKNKLYIDSTFQVKMVNDWKVWSITIDSSLIQAAEQVTITRHIQNVQIDSVWVTGEGTTNLTWNVHYGTDRSSVTDSLFDALQTANSTSTGNAAATNDGDLSINQHMWVKIFGITTKPTELSFTFKGRLR